MNRGLYTYLEELDAGPWLCKEMDGDRLLKGKLAVDGSFLYYLCGEGDQWKLYVIGEVSSFFCDLETRHKTLLHVIISAYV